MADLSFPIDMLPDIEDFLSSDANRNPGQNIYPEVFQRNFFPLQRQDELVEMIWIAKSTDPKIIFEIGADKAGGLYHWVKCCPTVEKIIACEIRGTPYSAAFEKAFPNIQFLWLAKSSYAPNTVAEVKNWIGSSPIDILFIDGDKANFLTDFQLYFPMIRPGGFVFVHDIQDGAPWDAYTQMIKMPHVSYHTEIIYIDEAHDALAREHAGIPSANRHEDWLRYWKGKSCGVGVICKGIIK